MTFIIPDVVSRALSTHTDCDSVKRLTELFNSARVYDTAKFSLSFLDVKNRGDELPRVSREMHGKWLSIDAMKAISKRVAFYHYVYDYAKGESVLGLAHLSVAEEEQFEFGDFPTKTVEVLYRMWQMCSTAGHRNNFDCVLERLMLHPTYRVGVCIDTGRAVPVDQVRPIKDTHGSDGYSETVMPDNLWACNVDEGDNSGDVYVLGGNAKKASQRITKLLPGPDAVCIGTYKVFIAADIPVILKNLFNTGAIFTPRSVIERDGLMRLISPYGIKAGTIPLTNEMHVEDPDTFIGSDACFKGGINGIYAHLSGKSFKSCMISKEEDVMAFLKPLSTTKNVHGWRMHGWIVELPIWTTSFYVLDGLVGLDVERADDVPVEIDTETESGSFYVDTLAKKRADVSFSVLNAVKDGAVRAKAPRFGIKNQEFRNIFFGHGPKVMKSAINYVIEEGMKERSGYNDEETYRMFKPRLAETLDYLVGRQNVEVVDWNILRVMGQDLCPGMFRPRSLKLTNDADVRFLDGGTYNGLEWPGLRNGGAKSFRPFNNLDMPEFYIPSGEVMSGFIHDDDDGESVYLSGPARSLYLLFIAERNPNTNWELKWLQHMSEMQTSLLGSNISTFTVKGSSNKLILPGFWLNYDQIACTDPRFAEWRGKTVMYSKMPVLHHQAAGGYEFRRGLPSVYYGGLSDEMKFALRDAVFVSPVALLERRDDCDGDLGRIAYLGKDLPRVARYPDYMAKYVESYIDGENDLELKYLAPVIVSHEDMVASIDDMIMNKKMIGPGTNSLFMLETVLESLVSDGHMLFEEAVIFRNSYACAFQCDVIGAVKHEAGHHGFIHVLMRVVLMPKSAEADDLEDMAFARNVLMKLVETALTDVEGIEEICNVFFNFWDEASGVASCGYTAIKSRRVFKPSALSCDYAGDMEDSIASLDATTHGYLSGIQSIFTSRNSYKELEKLNISKEEYVALGRKYILLRPVSEKESDDTTMSTVLNTYSRLAV